MHRRSASGRRALATFAAAILATATAAQAAPTAITEDGIVTGKVAEGMNEFLGIRYAAPPVGALRWQPPQPLARALFSHTATSFGPHCVQPVSSFGIGSTTEDCLYLNVYTPAAARPVDAKPLPVMIWIHGGALITGESNDYDPAKLIANGNVIVVTINYRLGYLGFLADAGLDAEGHVAANYGLQDQQFAMDWVRRNIAGFGGDPARTTIFGESAGGLSVLSSLVSPTAYGLFSRAIVESGGYALSLPTLATAETNSATIAKALGCAATDTACQRAAPVSAILAAEATAGDSITTIVDGTTLPLSINTALKTGQFNRVPLLNGSNHDEYRLFTVADAGLTAAQYPVLLAQSFGPALGAAIAAKYPAAHYAQPVLALAAAVTDDVFACPARQVDLWVARYEPVYAYEFNDENAPEDFLPPTTYPFGAAHASEIQFIFNLHVLPGTPALTAAEEKLSTAMTRYWTAFATKTSPDRSDVPEWQPFEPASDVVQSLLPPKPAPEDTFATDHHCAFWKPLINPS